MESGYISTADAYKNEFNQYYSRYDNFTDAIKRRYV